VVAIPAAVAYAFLNSRVNSLMHDMERAGIEIVNILCDHRKKSPEIIDFVTSDTKASRRQTSE
jgi:biopolymer transport protein ExbB